jgi:hypothetical protein
MPPLRLRGDCTRSSLLRANPRTRRGDNATTRSFKRRSIKMPAEMGLKCFCNSTRLLTRTVLHASLLPGLREHSARLGVVRRRMGHCGLPQRGEVKSFAIV